MSHPTHVPLAEVVTEAKTGFACGEEDPAGVFQIRMNNVTKHGELDLTKKRRVPSEHKALSANTLQQDDVLFNVTNSPDLVGKTAIFSELDEQVAFSNHFLRLTTNPDKLLPQYLAYWLHAQFEAGTFRSMCKQWVNQATVSKDSLLRLPIPLLSIFEQQRAVQALDTVGDLKLKRRKAIDLLDELTQSIFYDMFGRISGKDHHWPSGDVSDLVAGFESGKSFGAGLEDDESQVRYRILRVSAVTSGRFLPAESKPAPVAYSPPESHVVRNGDLLISRANTESLLGATALVDSPSENLILSDKIWRFLYHDGTPATPFFLRQLFRQSQLRREIARRSSGTSGSMKNISQLKVLSIDCGIPPAKLRKAYDDRVRTIESVRLELGAHLSELEALSASLQHRAFRGELCDTPAA